MPAYSRFLAHWNFSSAFSSCYALLSFGYFSSCFWACSFSERSHEAKELFDFLLLGYDKRGVSWVRLDQMSRKKNALGIYAGGCIEYRELSLFVLTKAFLTAFLCNVKCYGKTSSDDGEAESGMS